MNVEISFLRFDKMDMFLELEFLELDPRELRLDNDPFLIPIGLIDESLTTLYPWLASMIEHFSQ